MRILTLTLALLSTLSLQAQEKQKPPVPGTPRNFSIPEVRRLDLPNGLKVRFVAYGNVPKVAIRLVTQTGNLDENVNEVWLADVTGSMMEQGTATRSSQQIARDVAMMGGALNIAVGMNQTTISTEVFSESAVDGVKLVSEVARSPLLPESDLTRIKADMIRNLSIQRSQPGPLAAEKFSQVLYGQHPYGRMFPSEKMLESYTLEQVRAFHTRSFGAARSFL